MKRLVPLVAVFGLFVASCSAESAEVARVGDTSISKGEVLALRGSEEPVVDGAAFRDDLSRLIFQEVVLQALEEDFGEVVTEADVDEETARLLQAIEDAGQTVEDAFGAGTTQELLRRNAEAVILRDRATAALAGDSEFLTDLLEESPEMITEVCVRHVLVATRGEAEDVITRLDAGEEFFDLAVELSLDTATDAGDLGCGPASRYVPEFADATLVAPLGEVVGPVETQFGFHVLVVDDRTVPTAEELAAAPADFVPPDVSGDLFISWLNEKIRDADIEIASEVGTWNRDGLGIAPPGDDG